MGRCYSKRAMEEETTVKANKFQSSLPRVVFLNIFALSKQWGTIDSTILSDSIFIIDGRRNQLFPTTEEEMASAKQSPLHKLQCADNYFLSLIQAKDVQNCIIWTEECMDGNSPHSTQPSQRRPSLGSIGQTQTSAVEISDICIDNNYPSTVANQWRHVSHQLGSIDDPITQNNYLRLSLCHNYWRCRDNETLQYCTNSGQICDGLSSFDCSSGDYKVMRELLNQSNPTLIAMNEFNRFRYEMELNRVISNCVVANISNCIVNSGLIFYANDCPLQSTTQHSKNKNNSDNHSPLGDTTDTDGFAWVECYE